MCGLKIFKRFGKLTINPFAEFNCVNSSKKHIHLVVSIKKTAAVSFKSRQHGDIYSMSTKVLRPHFKTSSLLLLLPPDSWGDQRVEKNLFKASHLETFFLLCTQKSLPQNGHFYNLLTCANCLFRK